MDAPLPRHRSEEMSFGGRVEIFMRDGSSHRDEMAVADAHPLGARPFGRDDYIRKFQILTDGIIPTREQNRFSWKRSRICRACRPVDLHRLNIAVPAGTLEVGKPGILKGGIRHE